MIQHRKIKVPRKNTNSENHVQILREFGINFEYEESVDYRKIYKEICGTRALLRSAIERYSAKTFVEYVEVRSQIKSYGPGVTLAKFVYALGDAEGMKRWNEYRSKQSLTNTFEYKQEKFGMTVEEFKAFNKKRATTKENFISRHGEETGIRKWNEYCAHQSRAGITREWFIEKHGTIDGTRLHDELTGKKTTFCFSKAQLEIAKHIKDACNEDLILYGTSELCLLDENGRTKLYDITNVNKRKIIEYNGDYWHANPKLHDESFVNRTTGMSSKEIWDSDKIKADLARSSGYEFMVIWEKEYKEDPEGTILRCIEFMRN